MVEDNKVGAYPDADEQNRFGIAHRLFWEAWGTGRRDAWRPQLGQCLSIMRPNADKEFKCQLTPRDVFTVTIEEAVDAVCECYDLSVRLRWWKWREEQREELVIQ